MIPFIPIQNNKDKTDLLNRLMSLSDQLHLGIIASDLPLISNLAIIENIMLPSSFHHGDSLLSKEKWIKTELDRFQMADKCYHRPNQLSKFETFVVKYLAAKLYEPDHIILYASLYYLFAGDRTAYYNFLSGENTEKFVIIEGIDYKEHIESKISIQETDFQSWVTHALKA